VWDCTTWKVLLAASHVFTKPNLKFEKSKHRTPENI